MGRCGGGRAFLEYVEGIRQRRGIARKTDDVYCSRSHCSGSLDFSSIVRCCIVRCRKATGDDRVSASLRPGRCVRPKCDVIVEGSLDSDENLKKPKDYARKPTLGKPKKIAQMGAHSPIPSPQSRSRTDDLEYSQLMVLGLGCTSN